MAPADMGDEEIGLMTENYEEKRKCQGSWKLAILALIVGTLAVAGMACFTFHNPTQTLAKMEPGFIQRKSSMATGDNTNSGQQAAGNINNYYQNGVPLAPQESECQVKSETKARIQFRDPGTFISYTNPDTFEGKFFVNHSPVNDVKDLPRCLTKLWLLDEDLGGKLNDLPKELTNLSLPKQLSLSLHDQPKQLSGDVHDLPPLLQYLDLSLTSKQITGNTGDLPRGLVHLDLGDARKIEGYLTNDPLPKNLQYVELGYADILGEAYELPKNLTWANLPRARISGDVKSLPRGLKYAGFSEAKFLRGKMRDLPQHMTYAHFMKSKHIEGNLSQIPNRKHFYRCYRMPDASGGGFDCV